MSDLMKNGFFIMYDGTKYSQKIMKNYQKYCKHHENKTDQKGPPREIE